MATASTSRAWQIVKQHLPLIKFRKGGLVTIKQDDGIPLASPSPKSSATASRNTIEDSQLPPRYARKPLSDQEIEYIMTGGPK